jgi:hypothetical protein
MPGLNSILGGPGGGSGSCRRISATETILSGVALPVSAGPKHEPARFPGDQSAASAGDQSAASAGDPPGVMLAEGPLGVHVDQR